MSRYLCHQGDWSAGQRGEADLADRQFQIFKNVWWFQLIFWISWNHQTIGSKPHLLAWLVICESSLRVQIRNSYWLVRFVLVLLHPSALPKSPKASKFQKIDIDVLYEQLSLTNGSVTREGVIALRLIGSFRPSNYDTEVRKTIASNDPFIFNGRKQL